jgi:hypothetical protein
VKSRFANFSNDFGFAPDGCGERLLGKGRKQFFFEKKNQKTFILLVYAKGAIRTG